MFSDDSSNGIQISGITTNYTKIGKSGEKLQFYVHEIEENLVNSYYNSLILWFIKMKSTNK